MFAAASLVCVYLVCLVQARATSLAPSQWRQMLAEAQHITPTQVSGNGPHRLEDAPFRPDSAAESSGGSDDSSATAVPGPARADVVVLDVRNDYEWDAGHFQGAHRPQEVCLPPTLLPPECRMHTLYEVHLLFILLASGCLHITRRASV